MLLPFINCDDAIIKSKNVIYSFVDNLLVKYGKYILDSEYCWEIS